MAEHTGSGACIRFVDEREFKEVSVVDRQSAKESSVRICFRAQRVERSSESSSEEDEVDCSSELEIESDESETETQGSCTELQFKTNNPGAKSEKQPN